jgi:hypothetical protein
MSARAPEDNNSFEDLAREAPQSFVKEVWYLLSTDRRWWLAPIVIAIVVLGVLVMLSGTGVGPFIYTLF